MAGAYVRRAAKVDDNHGAVVKAFRDMGCSVLSLAALGRGVPDILLWVPRLEHYILVEIKDGDKVPSARKLTPKQKEFHATWPGPVVVIKSVDEAVALVNARASRPQKLLAAGFKPHGGDFR